MEISVNKNQSLFVFSFDGGCTTMGFENVFKILKRIVQQLGLSLLVHEDEKGSLSQYSQYQAAVKAYADARLNETWHDPDASPEVCKVIDRCIKNSTYVRLFYGDTESGRDWGEENNVIGTVSRTTGPLKTPILMPKGENFGDIIPEQCIVKIVDADTRRTLWAHERYKAPVFSIREDGTPKFPFAVTMNGEAAANFTSFAKAAAWVAFMAGECMHG